MKNTLEGISTRLSDTEDWVSKPEERVVEITEDKQQKKKE